MCNINIDDCAINPCHNGGTCVDGINSFTCLCPEGYNDATCLSEVDECSSNPCIHGRCQDLLNGWVGIQVLWEKKVHTHIYIYIYQLLTSLSTKDTNVPVTLAGVAKIATSITMNVSPTHAWMEEPARIWPADTTARAELASQVSVQPYLHFSFLFAHRLNEESLVGQHLTKVCSLIPTAVGPNCQTNINECASNPCLNQGTCIDDVAGYKCNCLLPYTGTTCNCLSPTVRITTANRIVHLTSRCF